VPARSPSRPPIAYDPVGGREGERAGAAQRRKAPKKDIGADRRQAKGSVT